MISCDKYLVHEETWLKAMILSRGVVFSSSALAIAVHKHAKRQNCVYNMPCQANLDRPQELFIKNKRDDYTVVVSCVAPHTLTPVSIETDKQMHLIARVDNCLVDNVTLSFVEEPEYYSASIRNGQPVRGYVSACGYDELNIIPWKGCAIHGSCRFCGANHFIKPFEVSAFSVSNNKNFWTERGRQYLNNLKEAISIALQSSCYKEHAHVILIAGNLNRDQLNRQGLIFAEIAENIAPICSPRAMEGIIAVLTPPPDFNVIDTMKSSGISVVVYNLEVVTREGRAKYCPGKDALGENYFLDRLLYSLDIMGRGKVWTNLVFGLEDKETTLSGCQELISKGIVVSANVLHLDQGNKLDCRPPCIIDILDFFYRLNQMNQSEGFKPFYCAKALRTSLSNESYVNRIVSI